MTEKKSPVISFKDFSFQYRAQKKPTLTGINLDIYPGEKVLIAGPSGSGKSTLAGCINGLNPFSNPGECKGSLTVDGVDAPHSSIFELAAHVGTVLQDPDGQFIGLTVGEDIAFALENSCTPQDEMHAITHHAAELVGIENHLDYAPHELSGGQKQRVSLAGVMVDQVKILLFDEPLANLDPATGKQAIELIDEIQKKTDTTVLIIEHRLEDVLWRNVDRIVLVNDGTILADLTPDELLSTSLLCDNGIREPLYVTAMRYAGIDITKEKKPAHVDSVVLDEVDRKKLKDWFEAQPLPKDAGEREKLLEVKHLSFGYTKGQQTLRNVSLSIEKGEMVSIVGRNGAGKSTFSKLICGFEDPDSGEITFRGKDLLKENIRHRAKYIGYVMQNPNQMISKTMIFDEVALSLQKAGLPEAEVRQKVEDTLKICGLYPFRNWPVSALSFGQKKRVTIASVLVQDPELIILDEPTAGQDFRHYTEIMEFLRKLNERGVTVVMITHDMHLMLEYTPRALVFSDGQLIADRRASEVLCDPELIERAALKETSLFTLANQCEITPPEAFVERFIGEDREVRSNGR
jgi:energy-coupling factor transporter ATP-binding protein EcfA2